jgi:ABC-2 type transport system permease protein
VRYLAGDLRALVASVRRDLRQIRRYPTLLIGSLFWPILLPANYVLLGRVFAGGDPAATAAFAERAGTPEFAGFVFVGFALYMWLSLFLWGPGTVLRQEQLRGTLESVLLTPVSRLVVLFGPPIAQLWPVIFQFAVMVLAMRILFGIELGIGSLAGALVIILVGVPAMYAFASLFSAFVLRFGEIGPAVQFVRGALVLLAGITYPLVMLPGWAQVVSRLLAPTYIVEDVRRVLLSGASLSSVSADLVVLVALAAATAAIAVGLFGWIERSARRTGALSSY